MPTDQTLPVPNTSGTPSIPTNNDFDISLNLESTPAQELSLDFSDITNIESPKPAETSVEINPNSEVPKTENIPATTTTDDRLKTEDQLVQQTLEPTPVEASPEQAVEQTTVAEPVVAETKPNLAEFFVTTEDIVKPEETVEQPVETPLVESSSPSTPTEQPVEQATVSEPVVVEAPRSLFTPTQEATDPQTPVETTVAEEPKRSLFQSSYEEPTKVETPTETPVVQAQPVEDLNQIATSITPTPVVEVPTPTNIPTGDLKKDEQIISQIQSIAGQQPQEPVITPTSTETTAPSTGVNLDDILGTPNTTPTTTIETPGITTNPITNQPLPPQTILPAFNSIGNYSLPTTNLQQVQSVLTTGSNNKKLLINIGIGIGIFVVGIFIFKTMYPLQYQSMIGKSSTQTSTPGDTISNNIDTTDTGTSTEDTNIPTDNLAGVDTSTTPHGSAPQQQSGFDAFEDINQVMGTGIDTQATKTQLQDYIDQGKKFRVTAKKSNNKDALKYSLFLWKKAEKLLQDVDNGNEITTDEINQQMDQFSGSLQKLKNAIDGQKSTEVSEQATQQVIPTPADFFGTASGEQTTIQSGTNQKENSSAETPAISGEQAFFQ